MRQTLRLRVAMAAGALGALGALVGTPALAALDEELARAFEIVESDTVTLDTLSDPVKRSDILRRSVDAIEILSKFAGEGVKSQEARRLLQDLASQAITADGLRLSLVEALLMSPDSIGVEADVNIKALVSSLENPAYRVAGWIALARAHVAAGQDDEGERLAGRAIEDAAKIQREPTRNGALRASVIAVATTKQVRGLAASASNSMSSASSRSELYQQLARDALRVTKDGKDKLPPLDELVTVAHKALAEDDLGVALTAAQAMDRDADERTVLLDEVLTLALERVDDALAIEAAMSVNGNNEQDDALRRIADSQLGREKPFRAVEVAALIVKPKNRADAQIAISDNLREAGYRQAAIDILSRIQLSSDGDPKTVARVVDKLASNQAFNAAEAQAATIKSDAARSQAYSRLVKRLTDAGRIDEARTFLPLVTDADDLSFAQSGLARALARSGAMPEALNLTTELKADGDRARAWEAIAVAYAEAGKISDARGVITQITDPLARSRALVSLASRLSDDDRSEAVATLEAAADGLSNLKASDEMGEVAAGFAELGEMGRSDDMVRQIPDEAVRDRTEARIAKILTKEGALDDARARATRVTRPEVAQAITADVAAAVFEREGDFERLVKDLRPLPYTLRVQTLHEAARRQALTLDRRGWLRDADPAKPAAKATSSGRAGLAEQPIKARFAVGEQSILAPVQGIAVPAEVRMPEIFGVTAQTLREEVPSPAGGVAHVAILGFSPFSQEAYKLTSRGTEAIYEVQVSQNLIWPRYIAIESGVVTFGQLLRDLPEAAASRMLVTSGDTMTVRVPIVVLPGATLLVTGKEYAQYRLSATSGAFLAVAGALRIQDAEVIGFDEVTGRPAEASDATKSKFRPFITAWGGSDLKIAGSRLAMLGYDSGKAYGLTQSSGAAVQTLYRFGPVSPRGQIIENSFENLRYGYYSYEAEDVQLIGNEYRDNIVYGIDPHDRSHRLVIALNTAYGTAKKHGIIVSREVNDSFIVGNVSLQNHGSGIMLDRMSERNLVYANTGLANKGDGLNFYESGCNIAIANRLAGNQRAGVKIRNSTHVGLYDNAIEDNVDSGADIYVSDLKNSAEGRTRNFVQDPFLPIATTVLGQNRFSSNGRGINSDGATAIVLDRNHFNDQRNHVFTGDLLKLSSYLLQIGQSSSVAVDNVCRLDPARPECRFDGWTAFQARSGASVPPASPPASTSNCSAPAAWQAKAVSPERNDG